MRVLLIAMLWSLSFGSIIPQELHLAKQKVSYAEKVLKRIAKSVKQNKKVRTYRVKSIRMVLAAFSENGRFEDKMFLNAVIARIEFYNLGSLIMPTNESSEVA